MVLGITLQEHISERTVEQMDDLPVPEVMESYTRVTERFGFVSYLPVRRTHPSLKLIL